MAPFSCKTDSGAGRRGGGSLMVEALASSGIVCGCDAAYIFQELRRLRRASADHRGVGG